MCDLFNPDNLGVKNRVYGLSIPAYPVIRNQKFKRLIRLV